jgi:hypothetical protein
MAVTSPELLEALPDLTLAEAGDRWGMSIRNSVKARAAALGVELRRESSTRTVWPAEYVALGDRLAEHLKNGGTLASFGPSVTALTDGSDGVSQTASLAPGDGSKRPRRSGGLSLMAATDGPGGAIMGQRSTRWKHPSPPPHGVRFYFFCDLFYSVIDWILKKEEKKWRNLCPESPGWLDSNWLAWSFYLVAH